MQISFTHIAVSLTLNFISLSSFSTPYYLFPFVIASDTEFEIFVIYKKYHGTTKLIEEKMSDENEQRTFLNCSS